MASNMIIPAARTSLIPTVTVPALRALKIALYTSQDGETVSVPEGVVKVNTVASTAKTMRPGRKI